MGPTRLRRRAREKGVEVEEEEEEEEEVGVSRGDVRHQTPHPKAPFGRQGSDTPHQIFNTCVGVESMGLNKNSAAPGRRISCQPRCSILSAPRLMADSSSTGWQAPMHRFGADGGDESLLVGLADGEVVASSCSQ